MPVRQHDGSVLRLRKLEADYDPTDRLRAMTYLEAQRVKGEVVTGLLYLDPEPADLHDNIGTVARPLNQLGELELIPNEAALEKLNASMR